MDIMSKVPSSPREYLEHFKQRKREFDKEEFTDRDLLRGLICLRDQILAARISVAFKPKGVNFIEACIRELRKKQEPVTVIKKPKAFSSAMIDRYPDDF